MDSLIEIFHIDWRLLLAQIINFGVAFSALYFFALKPLQKVMAERSNKIAKSLDQSKEIEKRLTEANEEYRREIFKAKAEAAGIVEKAALVGEEKKKEMLAQAKQEIETLVERQKAEMENEKNRISGEIKKEVAGLVAESVEKILEKEIDEKKNEEIIKEILAKK
ncbi:MAG: F0F1 ATP synthase subunit B [Candidatus Portnoybacteria bacterium]|nr:F0F1 ATP synthase subunit B [Candidatus Portnoybacteria bacterium]